MIKPALAILEYVLQSGLMKRINPNICIFSILRLISDFKTKGLYDYLGTIIHELPIIYTTQN